MTKQSILPFNSKLIPVLTINDVNKAAPLAIAMKAGGIEVAEVTFRTADADDAIKAMKAAVPDMQVGAGTIVTQSDIDRALQAGSDFLITPATTPDLLRLLRDCPVPVYPGASTASEALELYQRGYKVVKFFPAEAIGGAKAVKSIGAPLPQITFIPTGGINAALAPQYLSLANVAAIGGSWMIDEAHVQSGDWDAVSASVATALKNLN